LKQNRIADELAEMKEALGAVVPSSEYPVATAVVNGSNVTMRGDNRNFSLLSMSDTETTGAWVFVDTPWFILPVVAYRQRIRRKSDSIS
jgi:hypothetical protein